MLKTTKLTMNSLQFHIINEEVEKGEGAEAVRRRLMKFLSLNV